MARNKIRPEDIEDIEDLDDPYLRHLLSRYSVANEYDTDY